MADQFPMLSLTPDVPDPVAPSAAPAAEHSAAARRPRIDHS